MRRSPGNLGSRRVREVRSEPCHLRPATPRDPSAGARHHERTMMAELHHDPVMAEEVLRDLALTPGETVADGTLGLAGHSRLMARQIAPGGSLLGFDWDAVMLAEAKSRLAEIEGVEFDFYHSDFRALAGIDIRLDGILLDLGLNSAQLDDPERGISFKDEEAPLDMRMDRSSGEPAAALLNRWSLDEITDVLHLHGDERWARAIARKILERRRERPLRTVGDLVECVLAAIPVRARDKRLHPATRTFQAVRIAVTRELEDLEETLFEIAQKLADGGRMVVLSYHSGEDRATKRAFRRLAEDGFENRYSKPLTPTDEEIRRNPRARSAKMRTVSRPTDLHGSVMAKEGPRH
ncbi:16S rRNA (cytosine(1402)-N(4))-methyltransferase RsmH [bacterium]|nr:MAG: 16S rRNA (cytosine(1402)-N(4))-methyltransferase RsmH [bacterium]